MLVVPHVGKLSWKNPPYITICLILINIFVFFAIQSSDGEYYQEADKYYHESGLIRIETSAYLDYLEESGQKVKLFPLQKLDPDTIGTPDRIAEEMFADEAFMEKLKAEQIITPGSEKYGDWKKLRTGLEDILGQSTSQSYGYKPAESSILTAFTYMFLHGGVMHLVGNMVFLWLVGCMIEMGCGRTVYLATYLLTGIISCLFFGMIYADSPIPLIGASGAIAGMMGFYTILFGKRTVGIFLSLGFYFTNTRVPALLLLPFWIGNELYQLFLGGPSNVAYVGHLGGLISGAAFGIAHRKFLGEVTEEVTEEEMEERVAAKMEKGLQYLADLNFDGARKSFEEVLQEEANHRKAMFHLFQIDSQEPAHENFHTTASRLLSLLSRDPAAEDDCLKVYRRYIKGAGTPSLGVEATLSVNRILLKKGLLQEAATILTFLLKNHASIQQVPGCLLNLAKAYQRQGGLANARKCLQLICSRYPASPEFEPASNILQKSGSG